MKKLMVMFMIIMLIGTMFTGCASGNEKQTEGQANVKGKTKEVIVDKIKITSGLWSRPEEQQFIREEILPVFTEETGIEVELEVIDGIDKLLASQKDSGKWTSDIVMTHSGSMPNYINNGFVKSIDDLIDSLDVTVLDSFNESTKANGKTYYIPISADVYLVIANTKAMKYLPKGATLESLTWEQYKDWAIAIAKVEGPKVTFPAEPVKATLYQLGGISLSYGGEFPDINSEGMKETWSLVGEMMSANAIVETTFNYNNPIDQMKSEEAWLSFYHMVPIGDIYGSAPAKYEVGPAPAGPNGNGTIAGAWGIGITAGTEKVKAAEEFIRYMTSSDVLYKIAAGTGGFIPPVEEVIAELGNEPKDIIMKKGLETLNNGIPSGVPASEYKDWGAVKTVYDTVFRYLWDNNGQYTEELLNEQQSILEGLLN